MRHERNMTFCLCQRNLKSFPKFLSKPKKFFWLVYYSIALHCWNKLIHFIVESDWMIDDWDTDYSGWSTALLVFNRIRPRLDRWYNINIRTNVYKNKNVLSTQYCLLLSNKHHLPKGISYDLNSQQNTLKKYIKRNGWYNHFANIGFCSFYFSFFSLHV